MSRISRKILILIGLSFFVCSCASRSGFENSDLLKGQRETARETERFEEALQEIVVEDEMPFVFDVDLDALSSLPEADKEVYQTLPLYTTVLALIKSKYVKDVSSQELLHSALKGMCWALDDNCEFLNEQEYIELKKETNGTYGGIGLVVNFKDGLLTVIAPLRGSPADKAGIKSGDSIVKIDDTLVNDLELFEAVELLRGEAGSKVNLTCKRRGQRALIEAEITRAWIEIESVKEMRLLPPNIAYIRVIEFDSNAPERLKKELKTLRDAKARGLILDLRDNPGGLLSSGIDIAHYFLNKGDLILSVQEREGKEVLRVVGSGARQCPDIPIVVLLNGGSASASEIMAAVIRDHGYGRIVGETSYGKGSVQMVIPFKDKTALRFTTAMYYTPNGTCIDQEGITPDVEVAQSFIDENKIFADQESVECLMNDNQIVTAVATLEKMIVEKEAGSAA
jgi:carboxyl-terminal processing protease